MGAIYDFRAITEKKCGVQAVAILYLEYLLTVSSADDIFLFNKGAERFVDRYNRDNKFSFSYYSIGRFNILDGLFLNLKFGFCSDFVSFHSSLPIFFKSSFKKYFICHDIFVIKDLFFFDKYSWPLRFLARVYFKVQLKFSFKQATIIMVPSDYVKRTIESIYPEYSKKIKVIYNPISRIKSEFSMERTPRLDKIRLLYIGNMRSYKGFGDFLPHFRQLDWMKYELIVLTSDSRHDYLKNIPNLHVFFKAKDELKNYFIVNSDILVIPSRFEGFGLPVLEGVFGKCRVILSCSDSFDHFDFLKIPRFNFTEGSDFEHALDVCIRESDDLLNARRLKAMKKFDNIIAFYEFSKVLKKNGI